MPLTDSFACDISETQVVWNCLSSMASQTCIPRTGVTDAQELALCVSVEIRVLESTCVHDRAQVTNGRLQ